MAAAALGAVTALTLAACGSASSTSASSATSSSATSSAVSTSQFKLATPGTITVAYSPTSPSFMVTNGQVTGVVPDIINAFAKANGLQVKYFQTTFDGTLTAVQTGQADVSGAAFYNTARAKTYRFTSPYLLSGATLVMLKSTKYTGPSSLAGDQVGAASGYTEVQYLQKALGSRLSQFTTESAGIEALKTGRIAAYEGGTDNAYYAKSDPDLKYVQLKAGDFDLPESEVLTTDNIFASCSNQGLAAAIDKTIAQMTSSGQLQKIITGYLNSSYVVTKQLAQPNYC